MSFDFPSARRRVFIELPLRFRRRAAFLRGAPRRGALSRAPLRARANRLRLPSKSARAPAGRTTRLRYGKGAPRSCFLPHCLSIFRTARPALKFPPWNIRIFPRRPRRARRAFGSSRKSAASAPTGFADRRSPPSDNMGRWRLSTRANPQIPLHRASRRCAPRGSFSPYGFVSRPTSSPLARRRGPRLSRISPSLNAAANKAG